MRRARWDPGEPFWPTLGAVGQITTLSDRPVKRRAKRVPFGFQPATPQIRAGKRNR